jgi:DNA-binding transcriptional ArsR family regulator
MDLDFKSVKALSSPTRIKILNQVLEEEATTTKLSDELGKSKSTVSSHLRVLSESGLLEKDKEEGRRRVVYRPTDKTKAIIEGKERKVRFSVVSSALTGLTGLALVGNFVRNKSNELTSYSSESAGGSGGGIGTMDTGGQMMTNSVETANRSAEAAQQAQLPVQEAAAVIGIGLIITSVMALGYSFVLKKLRG